VPIVGAAAYTLSIVVFFFLLLSSAPNHLHNILHRRTLPSHWQCRRAQELAGEIVVINYKGGRAEEHEVKFMDPTTAQHLANQV